MKKLIYFFLPFCLWLLSISSPAQCIKIIKDTDCGLYKGEILMISDSLYNKEGKLATPKYGKIRVLGFTEAYNASFGLNKTSNFQKDSLYDISQDAADLYNVHFKDANGIDRWWVTGLEIEKVQTGYMADSSQLYYKAYLPNDTCWFVSTKDAKKYVGRVSVDKTKAVLDKSYREENDVYIVCEDNGRIVVEGIAKPFTIKAGEETRLADVSGKKMRFIFDGVLSAIIPFEQFKPKGEPTPKEMVVYILCGILLLLILCLIWKYRKQLLNWLRKIDGKKSNEETKDLPALSPTGELQDQQTLQSVDDSKEELVFNEKSDKECGIESIQSKLDRISQFITKEVSERSDEEKQILEERIDKLITEKDELITDKHELIRYIKVLQAQESNSSDFIKNGVKVEGCDSFIGFSVDFLSVCQKAEGDIYFRMKKMPVDEKVKAEPILSEYYQTRPTLMIEKWKGILATLKMCGYVSDVFIEAKNSIEREKCMQECFFKEVVRPYVSALLICLERFRTGEYINLKLDDSFVMVLIQNIEEIIRICRINEIEVIYQRLFEELNLVGEQYKNYEITYQKPDNKLSNWLIAKDSLKNNLLLSVSEYAVNSITTKRGYSWPEKTKCTVMDV